VKVSGFDVMDRMAIVMAHPDDEVLWACSSLRAAEKIVLVYGELPGAPDLTAGRRAAMAAFPLKTLDWLEMTESGVFDSASWPEVRETEYGLYPHPALRVLRCFDADRYRAQFGALREALRPRLTGLRNVIAHGPWGEYGHEDHVQVFRVVASLSEELGFRLWVPAYVAAKSEGLMLRNLSYFGRPTPPMAIDATLAHEIADIYKRTRTWTWFDSYVWPKTERFLPWIAGGVAPGDDAEPGDVQRIVFPPTYEADRKKHLRWRREVVRKALSWMNGRRLG
jgi:LmbE family N-acetylglucosaminyl deacetylase